MKNMTNGIMYTLISGILLAVFNCHAVTIAFNPRHGNGAFADGRVGLTYNNGVVIGSVERTEDLIVVGDDSGPPTSETIYRGFVGFDTSAAAGLDVRSIILKLYVGQGDADVGPILVDLVNWGNSLDTQDYFAPIVVANVGIVPISPLGFRGYHEVELPVSLAPFVNSGRIQLMLRGASEVQRNEQNTVFFEDVDQASGVPQGGFVPELIIVGNEAGRSVPDSGNGTCILVVILLFSFCLHPVYSKRI